MSVFKNPNTRQFLVSLPIFSIKICTGMGFGFTSTFLKAIQEPDSDIKMDIHISTWFVSSFSIAFIIGYFIGTFTMSRYGRRMAMTLNAVPGIVGQITTYFAGDVTALMIGRILAGVSIGSNSIIGLTCIGEYVSPENRGMILNMSTAIMNIGSLIVHTVGYYTSWRTLAIITVIPFIFCLVTAYASPESPSWLAESKQYQKSREAFYWLRGRTEDTTREIETLIRAQQQKKKNKRFNDEIKNVFLKFKNRSFWKPLKISLISIFLTETSGRHLFPAYAGQLMSEVMSEGVNTYYYNIVIDIFVILSGLTAAYMIRIMKMRTLLFTTGAATATVLCLACLSLYLIKNGVIAEDFSWLALVLFALFVIFGSTGCTCVPFALIGELFPLEHKAVASLIHNCVLAVIMSVFLKIMPYMVAAFYIYGAFLVMAVCMSVVLIVLYFILPETTNKTLQEIEEYFTESKRRDDVEAEDEEESLKSLNHM